MMKRAAVLFLLCIAAAGCVAQTEVTLPRVFGDSMVIQRNQTVNVWGTAEAGADVKVKWRGQSVRAKAAADGKWSVRLDPTEAGGPFKMKVGGKTLNDIMVGDVYLCSGQSNMELPVRRCLDAVAEDVKGYSNRNIRYLGVPTDFEFQGTKDDISGGNWEVLDSDSTAMNWGAVCYFTAKALQKQDPDVPIGMINSSVGGSPIEAWMSEKTLPDYALDELRLFQDKEYLDSIIDFNNRLYSDWQEAHNAIPENKDAAWKGVDIFSTDWAKDASGENIYGSHLLRHNVTLSEDQSSGDAVLHLGAMIDADSVFVNGKCVGNTTYKYPPRNYKVPASVLKAGDNLIEIHLYACGGSPAGFVREKKYSLETVSGNILLTSGWEHKDGRRMPERASEVFLRYKAAGLYNAMIHPLDSFRTSGVIWYQGESNCSNASDYSGLLKTMVSDWRSNMSHEDLKFYIIELAAFEHSELTDNDWGWNRIQKEQRKAAEEMEGVYLVPNADLGEWNDIHPQDKKTVGNRTAYTIIKSNK